MKLTVALTPPYDVIVEAGILARAGDFVRAPKIALVSDETVAPLYAQTVQQSLRAAGSKVHLYTVPAGEASKSLGTLSTLLSRMAQDGFNRQGAVVALGGGVVSDLAGYVAASYMRGIDFYILSTTLLGMVDASVGGKTGVNLPEGKNLVGAFWQPKAVLMDVSALSSLPEHVFREGAVEHFKHGLLADSQLLDDVTHADFRRDGTPDFLTETITRSVRVKAEVVAEDERENGRRAHLNLGHTLAHALEAYTKTLPGRALSHGDAVAYGLLFATKLAASRGYEDETSRVHTFLRWVAPRPLPETSLEPLLPFVARDKKHLGTQRWVLLERIGQPRIVSDIEASELENAWIYLQNAAKGLV